MAKTLFMCTVNELYLVQSQLWGQETLGETYMYTELR